MFQDFKGEIKLFLLVGIVAIIVSVGGILLLRENTPVPVEQLIVAGEEIETSNWQTYRNEEFGFEFHYPQGNQVKQIGISETGEPILDVAGVFTASTMKKPQNFSTLEMYVKDIEEQSRAQGKDAAAGHAVETKQTAVGSEKGLSLVEHDFSVWTNTGETIYLENKDYIYTLSFAYSRMLLESNEDELPDDYLKSRYEETLADRVLRNQILSTFRFVE